MDDDKRAAFDARLFEQSANIARCAVRHLERQSFIPGHAAYIRHKVELPAYLVPDASGRLRSRKARAFRVSVAPDPSRLVFGYVVRQKLVRVLPAIGQSERDIGQVAQKGGRQWVLAVHGKDHGCVETETAKALDCSMVGRAFAPARSGLHPGCIVDNYFVDFGDEARGLRPVGRGQEKEPAARQ